LSFAQIKVTANGDLKIASQKDIQFGNDVAEFGIEYWNGGLNLFKEYGSKNAGNYKMFINENTCNLGVNLKNNNPIGKITSYSNSAKYFTDKIYSFYGFTPSSLGFAYGIYGASYNSTASDDGRAYGVYGKAGNATNGYNYGVYGKISGSNYGAGIYGSVNGDYDVDGKYAGFFYGNMKVTGKIYYYQLFNTSDVNAKKEIKKLDKKNVSKLRSLEAVNFKYKSPNDYDDNTSSSIIQNKRNEDSNQTTDTIINYTLSPEEEEFYKKTRIGFIAQEVQELFPELVSADQNGLLSIDYVSLIPVIIEVLKDQESQIETLESKINNNLKKASEDIINTNKFTNLSLEKNIPNPFNTETKISFSIPNNINSAYITIYDLQGKQIKKIDINERGKSYTIISANEFQAGMYKYSLIADNQLVGIETMILTN
jgi:hypothetical protein